MADQATGAGFQNISGGISNLLQGIGGTNGIGDDIGNVINAIKGNPVPQNVTYYTQPVSTGNTSLLWIVLGAGLFIGLIFLLKK